jgi:hypothetical protein
MAAGTLCPAVDACRAQGACDASGTCTSGALLSVDDGNACTTDSCDPALGVRHVPAAAGTACPALDACHAAGSCDSGGACASGATLPTEDGNPCTIDSCDSAGGISHVPAAAGTLCPALDACHAQGACDASGVCTSGSALPTDDGNPCTADSCDPTGGVRHSPLAVGTTCPAVDACHVAGSCSVSGLCATGASLSIDDANACTTDSCDPIRGVLHVPIVGCGTSDASVGDVGAETGTDAADAAEAGGDATTVDTTPPTWGSGVLSIIDFGPRTIELLWTAATDNVRVAGYRVFVNGKAVGSLPPSVTSYAVPALSPSTSYTFRVEAFDDAGNMTTGGPSTAGSTLAEPLPTTSDISRNVATDIFTSTAFLYSGSSPVQTGVAAGTIQRTRASVLRGFVSAAGGARLSGVKVTILGHPEFGATTTNADGSFNMVVNGGGRLTVTYSLPGYLVVQRGVNAPWRDFAWLPDVALTQLDSTATPLDLTSPDIQVARASKVTDVDGSRIATVFVPPGTTATATLPDGTTRQLTTLTVRATELSVGADGPKAMPAALPANSAYTYDVELSADEADALGATGLAFSQPVLLYVENFIGFPEGTDEPMGYYDRAKAVWVASDNGKVIKIVSITSGLADIDSNGDGVADTDTTLVALGITTTERQKLATIYAAGQSLWRIPVPHFSNWDANQGSSPGPGGGGGPAPGPGPDNPCPENGSIIYCERRSLGERIPLAGSPFSLNYASDRSIGVTADRTVKITVSGATIPATLKRIDLEIDVAGQRIQQSFAPAPNLSTTFTWDGLDAFGR